MTHFKTAASFIVTEKCTLRCSYCVTGDTLITMADLSQKPITEVKEGEYVLGFEEKTIPYKERTLFPAEVTYVFEPRKVDSLYEITLQNGKVLRVTEDHPILANRSNLSNGWTTPERATLKQSMRVFTKQLDNHIEFNEQYAIGYLIGMFLGDGSIKYYKDGNNYDAYRVRLAVKDDEIIEVVKTYLDYFKVDYTVRDFLISSKEHLLKPAIFSAKRDTFNWFTNLINSNLLINTDINYAKGFLAGIYDAEGHLGKSCIRITQGNIDVLAEIKRLMILSGFEYKLETMKTKTNLQCYNFRLASKDIERFLSFTDNKVKRKRYAHIHNRSHIDKSPIMSIKIIQGDFTVYNIETSSHTYIANSCCVHNCFECKERKTGPDMTVEVAEAAVDLLYKQAILAPQTNGVNVTLFGGEPLIRPDICDAIIQRGIYHRDRTGIPFSAGIITNGTIMTNEIELMMFRWKSAIPFSIQVSIDGTKEANDLYRVHANGASSFDEIAKNIPAFQRIDPKLCLHGCLNKFTLPLLYESYRYFKDVFRHRGSIWFMPVHTEDWNEEDVAIYDEQLSLIYQFETKVLKNVTEYSPLNRLLSGKCEHAHFNCGAGTNYITFTGNGDIYPCHNIYFNEHIHPEQDMCVGNIFGIHPFRNKAALAPFENFTQEKAGCAGCENINCYRCIADNWVYNGDILLQVGKDTARCDLSSVEKKWQERVVEWAKSNQPVAGTPSPVTAPMDDNVSTSLLTIIDYLENVNGRVEQLEKQWADLV